MTETINTFKTWIQDQAQPGDDRHFALSPELRSNSLAAIEAGVYPTRKDEEWRYTPLDGVFHRNYDKAVGDPVDPDLILELKKTLPDAWHLIFIDGEFSIGYSDEINSEDLSEINIQLLPDLDETELNRAESIIRYSKFTDNNIFQHITLGLSNSGLFIHVTDAVDRPLHIIHLSVNQSAASFDSPINIIHLEPNSNLTLVEQFISPQHSETVIMPIDAIRLDEGARLDLYKIGLESDGTDHISNTAVQVAKSASFQAHQYLLGSRLTRSNLEICFSGSGAEAVLRGIYLGSNAQHLDIRTYLDHAYPNCRSDQHFRGIMDDHSRGVFNGMVLVREHAQQTDARQSNKNLLLSPTARIDTKPQLEIFADDVKCSHGATIGELDANALFYLQTRGISKADAVLMLTKAFAAEITGEIGMPKLREHIQLEISNRLNRISIAHV